MNKKMISGFILVLGMQMGLYAQPGRVIIPFNEQWYFKLGDDSTALTHTDALSTWRTLRLPHDWSIEGNFSSTHSATTQGGALPGGIGWYAKRFVLPKSMQHKNVSILFDGVHRNSTVWVNGVKVGFRPNGYISFRFDITNYLKASPAANIIAVRVDNSKQPNSRWYTGSGIYRNVYLEGVDDVHFIKEDFFVSTPKVTREVAIVNSRIRINQKGVPGRIRQWLNDANGQIVAKAEQATGGADFLQLDMAVSKPKRWSTERPYLYQLVTEFYVSGKLKDRLVTQMGMRRFYFDAASGFYLNDTSLKIRGVCMHHDMGALGAAVSVPAMERQLRILKQMGCNAIRTSHNPPAPELLDLCDRMGFLVMVEAFDMWKRKKNKFDYALDFKEWHQRDIEDMVKRDRNHPSVFMWSVGNEIPEQFDSTGISITQELVQYVKQLDTTRPVTAALSEWNPEKNFIYKSGALDVVGLNYHHEHYEDFPKNYPDQKFIGAENMSALATRGVYDQRSDSSYFWPAHSPLKYVEQGRSDYTVSAYDQVSAYWGSTHETTWKIIKKYPFLSGLFVWSGFDYLGEPTPYPWPARSAYFGIVDLAGFPKDVYYMYQSEWTKKPVLYLFPHWNWREGQLVDVWAYYNNADAVELFLNGKSLGKQTKKGDALHVMWQVPFRTGVIKAISYKGNKVIATSERRTAGVPYAISMELDKKQVSAGGNDLAFVTVRILDKAGIEVPDATIPIHFSVEGAGQLVATDNGYQADTTVFQSATRTTWKGKALGIIRSGNKQGTIAITVRAAGLKEGRLLLRTM